MLGAMALGTASADAATFEAGTIAAADVSSSSAKLRAVINPEGVDTTYVFVYAKSSESLSGPGAQRIPAVAGDAGAGLVGTPVSAHPQDLQAQTSYHFEVIAAPAGAPGEAIASEAQTFVTQAAGAEFELPDGRAWELVSPTNKRGAGIEPPLREGGLVQAAESGSALTYISSAPPAEGAEGNRALEPVQSIARRSDTGWSSQVITTPNVVLGSYTEGSDTEYLAFSADLSSGLVRPAGPTALPPLSEGAERTIYLRNNETNSFSPLAYAGNIPPGRHAAPSGEVAIFRGASRDLRHVIISSVEGLTEEVAGNAHQLENLYEWTAGKLTLVSVLPNGRPASEPPEGEEEGERAIFGRFPGTRNAVSGDGTRVVWETNGKSSGGEGHIFLRDMTLKATVQLDVVQEGVEGSGTQEPVFQSASSDGRRVFFTDRQRLTSDSHANTESRDLYMAEVSAGPGLSVTLTDVTKDTNGEEAAAVQGVVLGNSEDGSSVYYVANGKLTPAAIEGNCEQPECHTNLYVSRLEGAVWKPHLVARPGLDDGSGDWGSRQNALSSVTARVSPNGRFLAFMSDQPLTGYDNRDQSSNRPAQELFLFDASSGGIRCVSCNPSGSRPSGLADPRGGTAIEQPLVDPYKLWEGQTLAASVPAWTRSTLADTPIQPHYLSDTGQLFFDAADALVPADVNGKEDVYQYQPEGIEGGSCSPAAQSSSRVYERVSETQAEPLGESPPAVAAGCVALLSSGTSGAESLLLDASPSGSDVFILTRGQLTAQDKDSAFDIYDAHVCTALVPCPATAAGAPAPCSSAEGCRGTAGAFEGGLEPPSATLTGGGNLVAHALKPLTKAQQLAVALKACRRVKAHKKRVACERRARARYAPRHKSSRANRRHK